MPNLFSLFLLVLAMFFFGCSQNQSRAKVEVAASETWIHLFDGKSLEGWTPKFAGYAVGENYKNTFRVSDSLLQVSYLDYDTFTNQFGHLIHQDSFSHYRIRAEYRFVGEQVSGGQPWAYKNNGLMLHSQAAQTMSVDQEFPMSIEFQLLGGNGIDERTNGNVCTPGCHIHLADTLETMHCINANSKTFDGDQWVIAEAEVRGDSIIHHLLNGDTVMTYTKPVIGGALKGLDTLSFVEGIALQGGHIAIQAESHGIEFRQIEVWKLEN